VPQNDEPNNSKLILIGEDDLDDQEFLKEVFSTIDDSFSIVFASNGQEIFDYLDEKNGNCEPCLIVLDYNMPGLNGIEILRELKKSNRHASIPKIIWSTSKSPTYKDLALELGANDYLIKPSNVSDLTDICRYMLSTCGYQIN
jgi:CheY-like chemotaxis protein